MTYGTHDPGETYLDDTPPLSWEELEAADLRCTVEQLQELKAWEAARDANLPAMRIDYHEIGWGF